MRIMFSMEYFIIAVFCKIDDLLKEITVSQKVRAKGFAPALSDSEVITMEIVAEYRGIETDIGIWQYFREHWQEWFPALKSRTTFVRQAANLWQYKAMEYPYLCVTFVVHPVVVALPILRAMVTVRLRTCITMAFMVMFSLVAAV